MKARINGIEYEGQPEELAKMVELLVFGKLIVRHEEKPLTQLAAPRSEPPQSKDDKGQAHKYAPHKGVKHLTKQERLNLYNALANGKGCLTQRLEKIQKDFPNHTFEGLRSSYYAMTKKKYPKIENMKKLPKKQAEPDKYGYIANRTRSLMRQYGYDYEKARTMARDETIIHMQNIRRRIRRYKFNEDVMPFDTQKAESKPEFPRILEEPYNRILETVLKHMTGGLHEPLTFPNAGYLFGIDTIKSWHEFLARAIMHLGNINAYFGKGKFKIADQTVTYEV